jgi:hypothetical protein
MDFRLDEKQLGPRDTVARFCAAHFAPEIGACIEENLA